jgi:hypothetical protein
MNGWFWFEEEETFKKGRNSGNGSSLENFPVPDLDIHTPDTHVGCEAPDKHTEVGFSNPFIIHFMSAGGTTGKCFYRSCRVVRRSQLE